MHMLKCGSLNSSSKNGSQSNNIEKRRPDQHQFIAFASKSINYVRNAFMPPRDLLLNPTEVVGFYTTFREATKGDLSKKANISTFVDFIKDDSTAYTPDQRHQQIVQELQKLLLKSDEFNRFLIWTEMVVKIEKDTKLLLRVDRPEVKSAIESISNVSKNTLPRHYLSANAPSRSPLIKEIQNFRDILKSKECWEPADSLLIESASIDKQERDAKLLKIEGFAHFDDSYTDVGDRVDHMMELDASKEFIDTDAEMDALYASDDDATMQVVEQEDRVAQLVEMRVATLSSQQQQEAMDLLNGPASEEVLIEKYAIPMTRRKLTALRPNAWLNDEIINFYMNMLQDRDTALCKIYPARKQSHYFNSYFISKLLDTSNTGQYTYSAVKRWTKKFDIFDRRRIYFPINISNSHWTHLILYMEKREIHYFDSMAGNGRRYIDAVLHWVQDEAMSKKGIPNYEVSDFKQFDHRDTVPQQQNGYDCGVFSCIYADFDTDDVPFEFSQKHMPNFRLKITLDIMRGELTYPVTL